MLRSRPNMAAANVSMMSRVSACASSEPPAIGVTTTPANAASAEPNAQLVMATRWGCSR